MYLYLVSLIATTELPLGLDWRYEGNELPSEGDEINLMSEGWPNLIRARVTAVDPSGAAPIAAHEV